MVCSVTRALLLVVFLAIAPAPAFAQDHADIATPACDLECLKAVVAERDRQYTQRFDAADKAVAAALAAQHEATAAAFAAANTAVVKAETANEKRLDSVNEFRAQLKDQAATLSTRAEVTVQFKAMEDKVAAIQQLVTAAEGRGQGANNLWILILGGLGLLVVAAGIFLRTGATTKESARYLADRAAGN